MIVSAIFNTVSENKKKQEQQRKQQNPMQQTPKSAPKSEPSLERHTTPRQPTTPKREVVRKQPYASTEQKKHASPFDKLKDLSREFYKEIEKEFNDSTKIDEKKAEMKEEVVQQVSPVKVEEKKKVERSRVKETTDKAISDQVKQVPTMTGTVRKSKKLIPSHSDDIMKGVIFAEIIGPPKSKR